MIKDITFSVLHLFSGIGGAALGFQDSAERWWDLQGSFQTLAGIDCDPEACADFETITGEKAYQMDLFSREDYKAWHGVEPPEEWREIMPDDIAKACGGFSPDVVFSSPPCKGFSGLLPEKSANSAKYKALNNLTIRGIFLVLEAFKDDLPGIFLLENVPRITSRGKKELQTIRGMFESYGYAVSKPQSHDCGEIGGLGQVRRRFLLIARNPEKVPAFIYQPPKKKRKTIGDVIGLLPVPNDKKGGPMHRLPRLQWKTWVRLALIPAGGDWRDLERIASEQYRLEYIPRGGGSFGVQEWDKPSGTVTGNAKVNGSNAANIADPRLTQRNSRHPGVYRVVRWHEAGPCITGTRFGSGAPALADPRTGFKDGTHSAIYRVCKWEGSANTITGAHRPNNGAICINDPRLNCSPRSGLYGVQKWDKPGFTVTGARNLHSGTAAVSDPRIPKDTESGTWIIISEDETWHRPLTTYELAMLQDFPVYLPDGRPFQLAGNSDARWRERIGNAVPVGAAKAIGETILRSLLPAAKGMCLTYQVTEPVWARKQNTFSQKSYQQKL